MTEPIVHLPKNYDKPVTIIKKSHRTNTRLSVIIPMYNVALFLREALDSLLLQGVNEVMQVILIDDGSKDESPEIAKEYVEQYPDIFELYIFENGGLGAARNRGTNLAEGEYITYVDPDDVVVDESYEKMLKMISRTGSDVIGGAVRRFNSTGKQWTSTVHNKAYHDTYEATTLEKHPEMVWDTTAWNKIYRLDFILKYSLYFPEKMLYEDMPMVVPMYSLARTIDIYDKVIYLWRERDEGTPSITQSTAQKNNFSDRVKGMKMILTSLQNYRAPINAQNEQLNKMLNFDLRLPFTYEKYLALDNDYKDTIYYEIKSFLQLLNAQQFNQAYYWYRSLYTVWLNESKTAVQEAITQFAKYEFHVKFNQDKGEFYSSYQERFNFELKTNDSDFEPFTRLYSIIEENNTVVLEGHVFYRYMDLPSRDLISSLEVELVNKDGLSLLRSAGNVDMLFDPDASAKWGFSNTQSRREQPEHNFDVSHYRIDIPYANLSQLEETVYVKLNMTVYGRKLELFISEPMPGDKPRPEGFTDNNGYILFTYSSDWRLRLTYLHDTPMIVESDWKNKQYVFYIKNTKEYVFLLDPISLKKLVLQQQDDNSYLLTKSDLKFIGGSEGKAWWQFITTDTIEFSDSYEKIRMATPGIAEPHTVGNNMTILNVSNYVATLSVSWQYPVISSMKLKTNSVIFSFWMDGWTRLAKKIDVIFANSDVDVSYRAKKLSGSYFNRNLWEVELPLEYGIYGNNPILYPQVKIHFWHRKPFSMPLRWGKSQFDLFREKLPIGKLTWMFSSNDREEHRVLRMRQRTNREGFSMPGEKVAFWQGEYKNWLKEPVLEKTIMYSSYWGMDFNDNPRALYEYIQNNYPGYQHVAVYKDLLNDVSLPGVKAVAANTKQYWYYLARAKYFVNNVNFEGKERLKRPEQIEIQTMHGTPLKQMGFHVLQDWSSASYEQYLMKNRNWDYLTVPSDYVADIAQDAFRHRAKVLKTGYPRNDKLFSRNTPKEISRLKQIMHLPLNKKIVLYAPTWRRNGEKKLNLDFETLYNSLRDDIFLLIRPHHLSGLIDIPNELSDKIILADNSYSIDDYYLVADTMVTDYSSVMFDYALLKKPMIFYTYDYENYVSSRGLNFDFKADAPGPLVYSQQELVDSLNEFENISEIYKQKLSEFNIKFLQYDNGDASKQVFEDVFIEGLNNEVVD